MSVVTAAAAETSTPLARVVQVWVTGVAIIGVANARELAHPLAATPSVVSRASARFTCDDGRLTGLRRHRVTCVVCSIVSSYSIGR